MYETGPAGQAVNITVNGRLVIGRPVVFELDLPSTYLVVLLRPCEMTTEWARPDRRSLCEDPEDPNAKCCEAYQTKMENKNDAQTEAVCDTYFKDKSCDCQILSIQCGNPIAAKCFAKHSNVVEKKCKNESTVSKLMALRGVKDTSQEDDPYAEMCNFLRKIYRCSERMMLLKCGMPAADLFFMTSEVNLENYYFDSGECREFAEWMIRRGAAFFGSTHRLDLLGDNLNDNSCQLKHNIVMLLANISMLVTFSYFRF
uniref:Uncharacterized protein n=1 Tax=Ditylenchus dipsaci TaxID=166011 RepID=A0A915CQK7_9BILA